MAAFNTALFLALVGAASAGLLSGGLKGIVNSLLLTPVPPEAYWNPQEVIENSGYTWETHSITSADGYILTALRIPKGKDGAPFESNGKSIFLNHGFVNSAWDWFALTPDKALPFLLSNAGYDVWVGSVRGTLYSQKHEDPTMTIKNPKYWNFTLNEIGDYDVPAFIDYILNETGRSELDYVGYSQGCSTLFQLLSTNETYNRKVRKMGALAPPAYVYGTQSSLYADRALLDDHLVLAFYDTTLAGMFQVIPGQQWFGLPLICSIGAIGYGCDGFLESIGGFNPKQVDTETTIKVSGHSPAPASALQYIHWRQFIRSRRFARFDYGSSEKNRKAYGTSTPPLFNLTKVTVPVLAKYGLGDILVIPEASRQNIAELGNCVTNATTGAVDDPDWTHLDFLYGKDADELVYYELLEWLEEL